MSGKIKTALISVSDKTGLEGFVRVLYAKYGVRILSTGGTAEAIRGFGVPVTDVSDHTGFPACLDGRVKTLHPKVHGGILYKRADAGHVQTIAELGIDPIDLVVVNLYPFEDTVAKSDVTLEKAIENIDIGGPAMLRSAAKNSDDVTVLCCYTDYDGVLREMETHDGCTTKLHRFRLGTKVFEVVSRYDAAIAAYRRKVAGPP